MSAERRRREDHLPSDEWPTDPTGLPSGGRPGEAWSAEFHHEPGPRGSGHRDWPGDSQVDQDWASSYRFDGRPSDEPWRDPSQRGDSSPADQAWHHDVPPDDEDDWVARTQADQSWRYRSLADDHLSHDQPGAARRRASDNWPASTRAEETWRESRQGDASRARESYAVDPRATDPLAADGRLVDPFAADLYADDYAGGQPSGTHVVGGRRASDNWLAGPGADESVPAVDGRPRDGLTAGHHASSGRGHGGRAGHGAGDRTRLDGGGLDGGDGSDWDDAGRPGGRRRILVSVLAAVAVVLAFGAYGLIRVHDQSSLALQDSSSRPCPARAGRCHSHVPRTPGTAGTSPVLGDSGVPSPSGSATGAPSTAPSHPAPTSMAASVPPPTHSAPPPKPTPQPSASASQPTGSASSAAAAQVLTLINQARAQQGLPALAISSGLNASSAAHTSVMAGDCGLSHQCPGEPPLGTRLTDAGVHWSSAGENIGEGGPVTNSTAAITQMAVNLTQSMLNERPPDDGHRMNILSSSFHFTGITVFLDAKGTVWMTQDFSD
jgi:uncharacterized protein YkwD